MPAVSFRREWAAQVRYGAALAAGDLALAAQLRGAAGCELLPKRSTVRRVGGGWVFTHRMLLEYFRDLSDEGLEELVKA